MIEIEGVGTGSGEPVPIGLINIRTLFRTLLGRFDFHVTGYASVSCFLGDCPSPFGGQCPQTPIFS